MKLFIVKHSPLPILIILRPKYSPQDPVFECSLLLISVSGLQSHSTVDNVIVLHILKLLLS